MDAGISVERGIPRCNNCSELGHMTRSCPQEKMINDRAEVKCALCDQVGHRVRDCTEERKKPGGPKECRVCSSTEHIANDCPNREKVCRLPSYTLNIH